MVLNKNTQRRNDGTLHLTAPAKVGLRSNKRGSSHGVNEVNQGVGETKQTKKGPLVRRQREQ